MIIKYGQDENRYYDMNGDQIHEGDTVFMAGRNREVYATEDGYLGTDATNPAWIERGMAAECEYGVYPFDEADEPVLVKGGKKMKDYSREDLMDMINGAMRVGMEGLDKVSDFIRGVSLF